MYDNPSQIISTPNGEKVVSLEPDTDRGVLYGTWYWKFDYGYESIQEAAPQLTNLVRKHQLDTIIANLKAVEGTWDPINEWIVTEWLPELKSAGLKHHILIQPDDFFAQLSAEFMNEGIEMGGIINVNVRSLEEAFLWLDSQTMV